MWDPETQSEPWVGPYMGVSEKAHIVHFKKVYTILTNQQADSIFLYY